MIERSLLRPFIRHQANTLNIAYKFVSWGGLSRDVDGSFSINGACNVRMAETMLESMACLAHDRCVLTGLRNIVRLDPLFSLEVLFHPSNIRKDLFRYASRVSESFFVESVSCMISDYGRLCHILGSSVCVPLTDIRAMCLAEGISDEDCNTIISLMNNWLFNILHRSRPGIQPQSVDVRNVYVELEVVLAFLFILRSTRYMYDEVSDLEAVKKIGNIVHKLWELFFSRSTEYGGPVFCLFRLASAMCIIKSALISSSVIGGLLGTDYNEIALDNVFVCFKFACNECNHGAGAAPCGKQIIVGSCSNDAICNAINSIVTNSNSPLKALSSLLSDMQSAEWLYKFTWFDSQTANIVESLRRDLMLPFAMIERRCAPRLTSLAIKSIPHINSNDLSSLMAVVDNGFGACCAQRDRADSMICLKDAFMTAMRCYELFFESQMKSIKRAKWSKWIECVVVASPHRGLSEHDVCCFVTFISDLCLFQIHRECIMEISCKIRCAVNNLWCSGMSNASASCMADTIVSLCEVALFLGGAESEVLRLWLNDNIYVGSNGVKRPRNSLVAGFEECYRRGKFLLPHEMCYI